MTTAKLGIHEHLPLDDSVDESSDEALKPDFSSDESADGNYVPDSYSGSECASNSDDSRHVRNKRPHKRASKSDSPIIHAKKRKSNVNTSKENYVPDRHGGSSDDVSDSDVRRHVQTNRPHKRASDSVSPVIHAEKRKSNINSPYGV